MVTERVEACGPQLAAADDEFAIPPAPGWDWRLAAPEAALNAPSGGALAGVRYLGAAPAIGWPEEAHAQGATELVAETLAEIFALVSANVLHGDSAQPVQVVAAASALAREGRTTAAVCLARAAARQGARAIIVNCDLDQRAPGAFATTLASVGLLEVLAKPAALDDAIVASPWRGVDVLPLTLVSPATDEVFDGRGMDHLVARLRSAYDLVVLDTGPVLRAPEARAAAARADFVLFVARWRATPPHALMAGLEALARVGGRPAIGILINAVDFGGATPVLAAANSDAMPAFDLSVETGRALKAARREPR